ncbi:O-acetyltransferase OatA [Variovorax sp. PBL-E5]|nr:O-acetyltransferase OatA [Variovorax sp. SRS16]VTU26803.1 O-acetyltransferase OatA [Variovorax sp. PBL-E5]
MMVVFAHASATVAGGYTGWLQPLNFFTNGGLGVQIFFVLSGFLITNILNSEWKATQKIDLVRFYLRRTLRIWPAFYVFLVVLAFLTYRQVIDIAYEQFAFAALHVWNYSEALGLGPINAAHGDGTWYLGHFWTLALEEQFYWFWPPLLIFLLRRRSERLLVLLILSIPLIRIASYFLVPSLRGQLLMMLHTGVDSILIGCYTALNQERIKTFLESKKYSSALVTASFIALIFLIPELGARLGGAWSVTYGATVTASIVALIIMAVTTMKQFWLSRILRTRVFVFVGTISYSLYLWQQLFLFKQSPLAFAFPFNIVQAFAAATLSYWLIETPLLKIKDGLKKRNPPLARPTE